jgi:hypothetical protein
MCPGPKLPRDATSDRRCRECKALAGETERDLDTVKAVSWAQGRAAVATEFAATNPRKAGIGLGEQWSSFAEWFLIDVFDAACNGKPPGDFALAVAGSLARRQATPYSDLEFFFVVADNRWIVPFAEFAHNMWEQLEDVHAKTGSFVQDLFFSKQSNYNALTTSASCLHYDPDKKCPIYDPHNLNDMLEQWSFGDAAFEQLSGARVIAGESSLLPN